MTKEARVAAKSYTYTGNPGYQFPGLGELSPGAVVKLSDADAAALGGEFQPTKTTAADAAPTDTEDQP